MTRFGIRFIFGLALCGAFITANDGFAQGRGRGNPFGGSMLELLMNEDVRQEIELVDEQEQQLRELGEKFRDKMRSRFQEMRDSGDYSRMREVMTEVGKEVEKDASDVLLDHQVARLKQLQVQSKMQRGASEALASDAIREKLGLTDEQLKEIQEVAKEAQEEVRKKIQQAQKEAQEKILGVLTPEQQRVWKEMIGESFSFQNRSRFGGNRGPRGNRGGEDEGNNRRTRGFGRRPAADNN